jgi:hypothetical protein
MEMAQHWGGRDGFFGGVRESRYRRGNGEEGIGGKGEALMWDRGQRWERWAKGTYTELGSVVVAFSMWPVSL